MLGQKRLLDVDPDDLVSFHTAISPSTGRGQAETMVRAHVGAHLCREISGYGRMNYIIAQCRGLTFGNRNAPGNRPLHLADTLHPFN